MKFVAYLRSFDVREVRIGTSRYARAFGRAGRLASNCDRASAGTATRVIERFQAAWVRSEGARPTH